MMSEAVEIEVSVMAPSWRRLEPAAATLARTAAQAALRSRSARAVLRRAFPAGGPVELAIVLTDDRTVRQLNRRYRGLDKPTNVLSFAAQDLAEPIAVALPAGAAAVLGDVVLAGQTVSREAAEQGKSLGDHLAHLVVHGTLHLLGYDHQDAAEARRMEGIEARVLAGLGIADPYRAAAGRPWPARRAA
jgi:probable rRNA maturation factor